MTTAGLRRAWLLVLLVCVFAPLTAEQLPQVVSPTAKQRALLPNALSLLNDEEPVALFFDMELYDYTLRSILDAFPEGTLHAVAMKANPLAATLLAAKDLGFGCEVASPCELEHALQLGFAPEKIVMDSPAKTRRDLRRALAAGVHLNADNFEELERIDEILAADHGGGGRKGLGTCTSTIGMRVNPQYGEGAIAATGTIAATSKFGVPLTELKGDLLERYRRYSWLTAIHCHVGSQGCELELLVRGARSVLDLAREINDLVGARQVATLDLGGGMPVDYASDADDADAPGRITPARYVDALRAAAPELFCGEGDGGGAPPPFSLVTEYGRYASAKCGLMISKVEYAKSAGGRRLATVHCGADLFLRTAYQPHNWPHRVSAWHPDGSFFDPAGEALDTWDVVGPLCFRGDIVATGVRLPSALRSGCAVCVHDAGSYTLAMFSKYNSRQAPPVYGFRAGGTVVEKISDAETVDEALRMWQMPAAEAM